MKNKDFKNMKTKDGEIVQLKNIIGDFLLAHENEQRLYASDMEYVQKFYKKFKEVLGDK